MDRGGVRNHGNVVPGDLHEAGDMHPGQFIKLLWRDAPADLLGAAIVWFKQTKETVHVPLEYLGQWGAEDDSELGEKIRGGFDAYTSLGLRQPGMQPNKKGFMPQGGKRDIVALAGFVLDLDLASPTAHKATNLPKSLDEASVILAAGPDPSVVVDSGNGVQCWWLFDEPYRLFNQAERQQMCDRFERFQQKFIDAGAKHGLHVDKTATIQRVFRLPGALNWKTKDPKPTSVIYESAARYRAADLEPPGFVAAPPPPVAEGTQPAAPAPTPPPAATPAAGDPMEQLKHTLRTLKPNHEHKEAVNLLLEGKSFASPGARDEALQRLASVVVFNAPREIDSEDLVELFRPSLSAWAQEENATLDLDEEMDKALDKIERAIENREEKDAEKLRGIEVIRNFLRRGVDKDAETIDVEDADLTGYSLIQYRGSYWCYSFGQQDQDSLKPGYYGPFVSTDVRTVLKDLWENAPQIFSTTFINAKGETKVKTLDMLANDYATAAHKVVGHFELQDSYYDFKERTFHEAICPIRDFEPAFNEDIDTWLRIMGGDKAERLIDWIAAVPRLDKQCCAIYLSGPPGCGKSLLASGLAVLWDGGGPTELETIINSPFNAEMFRCPLVVLEEGLGHTKGKIATTLRKLTGTSVHTYNDKNIPTRKVVGNVRVLIAANNDYVLVNNSEELTALDLEAFIGRFLHIKVSREAADWLEERNHDGNLTQSWVKGGLLARHALYLRDDRMVTKGKRFLVQGEATEMHRAMVTSGKRNGSILEWITRYVTDPTALNQRLSTSGGTAPGEPPPVLIGDGAILVNTQGLVDLWDIYMSDAVDNDTRRPSTTTAGRALSQMSQRRPILGSRGSRKHFHLIDKDIVLSWAKSNQVGQIDRMADNFSQPLVREWALPEKDDE